ncbi:uncharacterized protein A1O9_09054 [Exophiala aquamarina CBS 119918]|uniref:Zn(2)-C6 fungal-type domain-containing protein n=1 Tax=Exophiala aquamarina CBS 119918 TaxID=1182545 RepID=A0A072P4H3_9EURO|nr:uncharacterized protein A1O9_09054 [Exophiala aquamarina CBS 119918]KEF54612.1 hypothetical protein A1O9_09054 [Exophiala aquamarina CBS 119918]
MSAQSGTVGQSSVSGGSTPKRAQRPNDDPRTGESSKINCQRCRLQKLKCPRDLPSCARCRRVGARCHYPTIKRRRAVDSRQCSGRNREVLHGGSLTPTAEQAPRTEARSDHQSDLGRRVFPSSRPAAEGPICEPALASGKESHAVQPVGVDNAALPPVMFGLSLLEVYFSHVYNSSVLLMKSTFLQNYIEGKVPTYLLRAVFALSTIFLRDSVEAPQFPDSSSHIHLLSVFVGQGLPWAQSAAREALSLADQPTLEVIQALQCLQLYWFSVGDLGRAAVHHTLSYRLCIILGYNKPTPVVSNESERLASELNRRCFWACWGAICVFSDPQSDGEYVWRQAAGVPLPATLIRNSHGFEVILSQKLDELWNVTPIEGYEASADNFNALNEVYKLLGVWAKVQRYLDEHQHYSLDRKHADLSSLSSRATMLYSPRGTIDQRASREVKDLNLLRQCLYHLCQIMLHSSVVPLFSPQPTLSKMSPSRVKASAGLVLQSTTTLATIFKLRVQENDGLRTISPLAAYVAFVTGSVLVLYGRVRSHMQISEDTKMVPGVDSDEMIAIRRLLRILKVHWWSVARLADKLDNAITTYHALGSNVEISQPDSPNLESTQSGAANPRNRPFNSLIRTAYVPDRAQEKDQEVDHDDTTTVTVAAPTTAHSLHSQTELGLGTIIGQNAYDQCNFQTDLDGLSFDGWLADGFGLNFNAIELSLDSDSYRNDFFGQGTLFS